MEEKQRGRALIAWISGLVLLAAFAAGAFWLHAQSFADTPLPLRAKGASFVVERGDGLVAILGRLRNQGVAAGPELEWKLLARLMNVSGRLQAGEYALDPGLTPRRLLQDMAAGRVIQRKFTIVPGWSFRELRAALLAHPQLAHEITDLGEAPLMEKIGRRGLPAEGRFLPQTYLFTRGDSDLDVLSRAAADLDVLLEAAWKARAKGLPLQSSGELLTLASIVEKETGLPSERPQIAGVFVRRLRLGMRLQTDPTVIYGMGSAYAGNIRRSDLETDTPYNTYTRAGLPPTPIAMAGQAAIEAAAHPADGDTLYFVARGGGAHQFSSTLAEHDAAVRKFQLKRQ